MTYYQKLELHALTPAALLAVQLGHRRVYRVPDPPSEEAFYRIIPHMWKAKTHWGWWVRQHDVAVSWERSRAEVLSWWEALEIHQRRRLWRDRQVVGGALLPPSERLAETFAGDMLAKLVHPLSKKLDRQDLSEAQALLMQLERSWLSLRTYWVPYRVRLPHEVARLVAWRAFYFAHELRRQLVSMGASRCSFPQQRPEERALCVAGLRYLSNGDQDPPRGHIQAP